MADGRKRCSWIHDGLTIVPNGDVHACCHKKPDVVGNIYENTLEEIYNGDRMREFRQQEIDGTLPCLKGCTIPQSAVLDDSVRHDYRTELRRLQVEFGERCNIRCIMCPQDHKSTLELDPDILVRNIDIPPSCTNVQFFGGEPTILKSAKKLFDHCIEQGAKVTFITNGLAIGESMAAKIALHARSISFSLNAASKEIHEIVNEGSKFEKVLKNIKRVIDAKTRLNGAVAIVGHMTIVEQNVHEIAQFIRKRKEFGFEYAHFGYDARVPQMLRKDPTLKARLAAEIEAAIAAEPHKERFQLDRLQMLGLVASRATNGEAAMQTSAAGAATAVGAANTAERAARIQSDLVYVERIRNDPQFKKEIAARIARNPEAFLTRLDAKQRRLEKAKRMDSQTAKTLGDLRREVELILLPPPDPITAGIFAFPVPLEEAERTESL